MNRLPLLALALFLPSLTALGQTWTDTPEGQVLLRPFAAAPYPHPSREAGLQSANGTFPRDPHYVDSTVGIVIPKNYVKGENVDYVVHFHGWSNHVGPVIKQYKLAEQLAASGANAILLVPQGPKNARDSGCGKLELDPGGFERLIAEVTAFLKSEGKLSTDRVGKILLSAHSGGYKVTARILHHGGLTDRISDVVLLDASYGNLEDFVTYATAQKDARLLSFHTQDLDDENARLRAMVETAGLQTRTLPEDLLGPDTLTPRGVSFIPTKLGHNEVPMKSEYFRRALTTSALPKAIPK
jgi:methylmalonyl-CoA mutase cobalamin-binding subunit